VKTQTQFALAVVCGFSLAAMAGCGPSDATVLSKAEKREARIEKREAAAEKKEAADEKREAAAEKKDARAEKQGAAAEKRRAAVEKRHAVADRQQVAAACHECGVVQSVHEVNTKGSGSGAGAVGGAVVGGVVGHQVGEGDDRNIGTAVGVVGGALIGHEVEKQYKSVKSFNVTVRFDDGSTRVINEGSQTSWRVGDKVKVVNGAIRSNS
jgi:outer membrane lipoprotein SlyB